jgi:hypothetical protein
MPSLPRLTLFTSWEAAHGLPAARIRDGQEMRRPCGCWLDPVVFGHHHQAAGAS